MIPLGFVTMMSYIFYSFVKVTATGRGADLSTVVPMMLKIVFGFFLTIGSTFTAGMSAIVPMEERKGGLRHMMHLFGLNSLEYFIGMAFADLLIVFIPPAFCSIILLIFDDIMANEHVPEFLPLFWIFGCTLNIFSYLFSHLFSNPETGIKYISLLYSLGFFFGPLVLWAILAAATSDEDLVSTGYSIMFYTSPLFTFWVSTLNISFKSNEELEPWEIFGMKPAGAFGCAILAI